MASFISQINKIISFSLANISKGEDRVSSEETDTCKVYAVFDGHGGPQVSNQLANGYGDIPSFPIYLSNKILEESVKEGFEMVSLLDSAFLEYDKIMSKIHRGRVGSTATVSVVYNKILYVAYVGDSQALVFKDSECIHETLNHCVIDNPDEKIRVKEGGATLTPASSFAVTSNTSINVIPGFYHNFVKGSFVDSLAMTRAFGHYKVKCDYSTDTIRPECALIAKPNIYVVPLEEDTLVQVVMASDGLWDVINPTNKIGEIKHIIDTATESGEDVAKSITEFADSRWKQEWDVINQADNTTTKFRMEHSIQWDDISCYYLEL